MKRKKSIRIVLLVVLGVFVVMQFFRIDKSHPEIAARHDFIKQTKPPKDIEKILRSACYDCHSYETEYPWYAEVAPVSWWLDDHIKEGREHLNFSEWGKFKKKLKNHKLHECAEETEEQKMPLSSYTLTHGDAKLSTDQRKKLAEWFESQMTE